MLAVVSRTLVGLFLLQGPESIAARGICDAA